MELLLIDYPVAIDLFLIAMAAVLVSGVIYLRLGRETGSLAFKVVVYIMILVTAMVYFTTFNLRFLGHNFISSLIIYGSAVPLVFFIVFKVANIIVAQIEKAEKQTDILKKNIERSSETSLNVANMTTELASSASEVNASSEEVSATTMEITLKARQQEATLGEIDKMAEDIKKITKIVTSIAEQTNLLALNASIEAGRAGEQGRGFAVVAEKVQQLAEESASSVEKTGNIVDVITEKIERAALASKEISLAMEGISAAAEEQTASMEEITATTNQLSDIVKGLEDDLVSKENPEVFKIEKKKKQLPFKSIIRSGKKKIAS